MMHRLLSDVEGMMFHDIFTKLTWPKIPLRAPVPSIRHGIQQNRWTTCKWSVIHQNFENKYLMFEMYFYSRYRPRPLITPPLTEN